MSRTDQRLREELTPVVDAYETLKKKAGVLDFVDLLSLTRDMIAKDRAVREELQRRFSHLFVDEFQDTDPLQAEILLLKETLSDPDLFTANPERFDASAHRLARAEDELDRAETRWLELEEMRQGSGG